MVVVCRQKTCLSDMIVPKDDAGRLTGVQRSLQFPSGDRQCVVLSFEPFNVCQIAGSSFVDPVVNSCDFLNGDFQEHVSGR